MRETGKGDQTRLDSKISMKIHGIFVSWFAECVPQSHASSFFPLLSFYRHDSFVALTCLAISFIIERSHALIPWNTYQSPAPETLTILFTTWAGKWWTPFCSFHQKCNRLTKEKRIHTSLSGKKETKGIQSISCFNHCLSWERIPREVIGGLDSKVTEQ